MRSPGMRQDKMDKMVDIYFKGREGSTMKSYESSYRKLLELCEKADLSIFGLDESDRCELWLEAGEARVSPATLRGVSAVVAMIREVMGRPVDISGRERMIKKSVIKERNLVRVRKEKRKAGSIRDVQALVAEARKTNARKDWRVAALSVLCYFGCRRLADLVKVRVEDITFTQEGIEIFMRRHKTDVFNEGAVCTIVGRGRAFDVRGFLEEYLERMGLVRGNCVFPKNLVKGNKGVAVAYSMMYRGLEDLKGRLGLEANLIWHSWRIGAATKGNRLGVRRTTVKAAGLWKSSAVDIYCQENTPGVVLSEALANSWD